MMEKSMGLAVALALGLGVPAAARADTILGADGHLPPDCSRGYYRAAHYRFPLLWRVYACFHYPSSWEVYPSDRFGFPPRYYVYSAHCPYEYPAKLYDYPTLRPLPIPPPPAAASTAAAPVAGAAAEAAGASPPGPTPATSAAPSSVPPAP